MRKGNKILIICLITILILSSIGVIGQASNLKSTEPKTSDNTASDNSEDSTTTSPSTPSSSPTSSTTSTSSTDSSISKKEIEDSLSLEKNYKKKKLHMDVLPGLLGEQISTELYENETFRVFVYIINETGNDTEKRPIVDANITNKWDIHNYTFTDSEGIAYLITPNVENDTNYDIAARKYGYQDNITTVTVLNKEETGNYNISSMPTNASIWIQLVPEGGWLYKGQTNKLVTDIPIGNHTVKISKGGYETWFSETEYLHPDQTIVYKANLTIYNNPPLTPDKPKGWEINNSGIWRFITTSIDPEGDLLDYKWDWGDGNFSDWLGPYASGIIAGAEYSWEEPGKYIIRVKARDIHGKESLWSDGLTIKI